MVGIEDDKERNKGHLKRDTGDPLELGGLSTKGPADLYILSSSLLLFSSSRSPIRFKTHITQRVVFSVFNTPPRHHMSPQCAFSEILPAIGSASKFQKIMPLGLGWGGVDGAARRLSGRFPIAFYFVSLGLALAGLQYKCTQGIRFGHGNCRRCPT